MNMRPSVPFQLKNFRLRVFIIVLLLAWSPLIQACKPMPVTSVRPDRTARAFLHFLDHGRFMEAYLLTSASYRAELPFPIFVSRMRARLALLGGRVQRRGKVQYPATGPRCNGLKGDWTGDFATRGKSSMSEKIAVYPINGDYRIVRYEVRSRPGVAVAGIDSEKKPPSGNPFTITESEIKSVTRLTSAIVAKIEKGPLVVDGLYIQRANPVAGKQPVLLRKFMAALRKRNTVLLRRLTGFGIKPRDAWRFRLLDMRYQGSTRIEDPELARYISHMHIFSGRYRRARRITSGVVAVFENGDRTKINALDLYGYEWNDSTAYLLLPRKAYLQWAAKHLEKAVVLKRKQQRRYVRWLRRQAYLKKLAKKKKEADKKKGGGDPGGVGDTGDSAGGGDNTGAGEKPPAGE